MENNEKTNKNRAPESMEDLISQLFFGQYSSSTEEEPASADKAESIAVPKSGEEDEDDSLVPKEGEPSDYRIDKPSDRMRCLYLQ